MNFLYCFDNNFNLQALNSINSIINKSKSKNLNFYIIHDSPSNFSDLIEKYLSEYKNIITIFKFDFDSIDFPKARLHTLGFFFKNIYPKILNLLLM